ncbi:hypothetical protein JRQ81_011613 [Phrynocephalus forsythii]|uniref:Phospholipase A2 inhibitor and Ly6/PLAUR domain-containing protein-like n=1 Tax=Phrynocephalus forsythii TaxID=171643 RepID=A0A9Q0X6R1_9SAUR|nr:hypothetical protein JRQ81_011613 [Phrynocephalus forsythii]
MTLLLKLLLFCELLRMGAFLECETCSAYGQTCTGETKTCSEDQDTCITIYTESNLNDTEIQKIERGCDTSYRCTFPPIFFHMGFGRIYRSNWVCCKGEDCATAVVKLPPKAMVYNGKQCPACYEWSETCKTDLVNCTGWDTSCFEVISMTNSSGAHTQRIMMGCTNKFVCATMDIEHSSFWLDDNIIQKAECTSQASRLISFIWPTFPGLFLLKILL